jgi:hypothetical protein
MKLLATLAGPGVWLLYRWPAGSTAYFRVLAAVVRLAIALGWKPPEVRWEALGR